MKTKAVFVLLVILGFSFSCKPTRYKAPRKPHNSYRPGGKNKWMDEKRRSIQKF